MIHVTKIKPMFTSIVTTAEVYQEDDYKNGLIVAKKGDLKEYQTVIAIGSSVRDINVGDKVVLNYSNYAVRKYSKDSIQNDLDNNKTLRFMFHEVTIDDADGNPQQCLIFNDRDVEYVFEGYEVKESNSTNSFVLPREKKIILN